MTTEQAIELLMSVKWNANIDEQEDKALSMAIEALPAQLDNNSTKVDNKNDELSCSESPNRSDTIYRQDIYDLIDNWDEPVISRSAFRCDVEDLPSAQPEREILDELMDIMKEYYFTHRYEYDEAWENGFMKCMNLIPNVYMKRGKDR